jgi:molecular chaperone GrpE
MTTGKIRIPIDYDPLRKQADSQDGSEESVTSAEAAAPAAGTGTLGAQAATPESAATEASALQELSRERDVLSDSLLRQRAEFDNYRRRAARELVEARERSQGELLGDLLPVLDNLERALDAAEHHDEGKVLGGVRMTRDMFVNLLRRVGVEEIETVGIQFDPQVHDAMLMQPSEQEEGAVTAVLERGYRLGERILRPAKVAVSSGPGPAGGAGADR